jgi:putative RecB family exonuclease
MIAPAFPPAHQSVPESLANPSNATATRLTGRDYTSWSALSTFRSCPLRYKFRYIDGLPEEFVSAALVFGTGIHTAIEQHFQAILSGDRLPSTDQLMFAYRAAWLPYAPDAVRYASKDTRTSLDALACRMLKAFQRSSLSSVTGRVLGVEEELRGQLAEGMPDLLGRVDLLTEDDDRLLVTDIKTSRSRWSHEQVEDSGEQLLLYAKLAADIGPGKKLQTRFLVLTKAKEPVVEEHVADVSNAKINRTIAAAHQVWRAIESGVFYPAPSAMNCSGCGYRQRCRSWPEETGDDARSSISRQRTPETDQSPRHEPVPGGPGKTPATQDAENALATTPAKALNDHSTDP